MSPKGSRIKSIFQVGDRPAECGRPAKGRGKLKLSPLGIIRIQVMVSHASASLKGMRRIQTLRAFRRPRLDAQGLGGLDGKRLGGTKIEPNLKQN